MAIQVGIFLLLHLPIVTHSTELTHIISGLATEKERGKGYDDHQGLETNIVDTPNFVSSYRLQPVVNDSDLLSRRDFAPLTHRIC